MTIALQHIYWPKFFAWLFTVLCAWASVRSAVVFAKHKERLYAILMLFGLVWAMLIVYYSESIPSELLQGFTGFLLVRIGTHLRRERQLAETTLDHLAPYLFIVMIVPSGVAFLQALGKVDPDASHLWSPTTLIATLITVLGYFSVLTAIGDKRFGWVVYPYATAEIIYAAYYYYVLYKQPSWITGCDALPSNANYFSSPSCGPWNNWFLFSFMALKIAFTAGFVCLALKNKLSVKHRVMTWWEKAICLLTELGPTEEQIGLLEGILAGSNAQDRREARELLTKLANNSASQHARLILEKYPEPMTTAPYPEGQDATEWETPAPQAVERRRVQ